MDLAALKTEIETDPLGRGYSGMTDEEVAESMNTVNRTKPRPTITGDDAFAATSATEFAALSDSKQQLWMAWCARQSIDPFQSANVAFVQWVFGSGSDTVSELANVRQQPASRADELGLGVVYPVNVMEAKEL